MYKIHINVSVIIFCKESALKEIRKRYQGALVLRYLIGKKQLFNYIDMLEKRREKTAVIVYAKNHKAVYQEFKSLFVFVKASGGLVLNPEGKLLAIFRRGHWDLPKGKLERGETIKQCAIREVKEETGLKNVKILHKLGHTYHTYYTRKKRRILKKTHWYLMKTSDQHLKLQHEEDIEHAIWVDPEAFLVEMLPIYENIQEIVKQFLGSRVTGKK